MIISMGFFKIIVTPLLRISNERIQRGRVKIVGIPEGTPKIEEKTWISRGFDAKKWEIPGGHGKIDSKSRKVKN